MPLITTVGLPAGRWTSPPVRSADPIPARAQISGAPDPGSVAADVTGTATSAQAAQAATVAGIETFTGTEASAQANQSALVASALVFTAPETSAQATQSATATAALAFTATATAAQGSQAATAAGGIVFGGATAVVQATQAEAVTGSMSFAGTATSTTQSQTATSAGTEQFTGTVDVAQALQVVIAASDAAPITGTVDLTSTPDQVTASGAVIGTFTSSGGGGRRRSPVRRTEALPQVEPEPAPPPAIWGWTLSESARQKARGKGYVQPVFSGTAATDQAAGQLLLMAEVRDVEMEMVAALFASY